MNTQTLNSESRLISSLLKIYANCPDSQPRNKAKNALSLVRPISPGLAGQRYKENRICKGRGKFFFIKTLVEWENVCIFAAREPAKPLYNA